MLFFSKISLVSFEILYIGSHIKFDMCQYLPRQRKLLVNSILIGLIVNFKFINIFLKLIEPLALQKICLIVVQLIYPILAITFILCAW